MGKLIDADELYAAFRRDIMGGLNWDRILREAKPVDAVPVVRCKDCEWWTKQDKSLQGRCARYGTYPTGEWFCAAGRKGER